MNFRIFKYVMILLVVCSSCNQLLKKEVIIKPSEIGVYYDEKLNETIVLKSGKHRVPISAYPFTYPIKPETISRNVAVLTKDGKEVILKFDFRYSVKPDEIISFHRKMGYDYKEVFISSMISIFRSVAGKYKAEDLDLKTIEGEMLHEIQRQDIFSRFINVKSIKLNSID